MYGIMKTVLRDGSAEIGMPLPGAALEKFILYYKLLVEANKGINLTSITGEEEVGIKHFVDSLTCLKALEMGLKARVIDVGTGAGFPGLPLKIYRPDLRMVLLDSLDKRIKFLREVVRELDIKGIELIHARAEDAARDKAYREKFDVVLSRAVAPLPVLSEYCLPFAVTGGFFVSQKGPGVEEELHQSRGALKILGGRISSIHDVLLPLIKDQRRILVIEKTAPTPDKYPRRAGVPVKKPL